MPFVSFKRSLQAHEFKSMEKGKWWRNSELGWGFVVRYDATRNECWKLCSPDGFVSQTRPEISFNSLELLMLNMSGIENTTKFEVCRGRACSGKFLSM